MKETRMFKFRTTLFVVFLWLLIVEEASCVEPSWMGKRKFAGEPTGIIRDIVAIDDMVFVGAENGLFRIIGSNSELYSHKNSPLGLGYISDLHAEGNRLYIAEFGNGIFTLSLPEKSFSKINLPQNISKKAWAVLPYKNSIAVSTLSKIVLIKPSGEIISIKDNFDSGTKMRSIYSLTNHQDLLIASEANHIIMLDDQLNEIILMKREDHFPALSKITYVTSIDGELYIGGIGGIYRISNEAKTFYPVNAPLTQHKDVECIIKDSEGRVWVAAGGLFLLNEESSTLNEMEFGRPRYSFDQIRAVQSIFQLENKQFLIASTQLGLISLDLAPPPINYLHETDFPYRKDIYSVVPYGESRFLAKTSDRWLRLESESGKLTGAANTTFEKEPIPIGQSLLVPDSECIAYSYDTPFLNANYAIKDSERYCEYLKPVFYERNGKQYIYYQAPSHAGFVELDNNQLSHHVNAPKDLKFLLSTKEIPAVILDKSNALYLMAEQGVWLKHELAALEGVFVYCMYADSTSIYLCTSGQGLKRFDIGKKAIFDVFGEFNIPRFIRAGFLDDYGNHWLATNKGFLFVNNEYSFEFDSTDGIVDTDFNYRGILPLRSNEFLLVGDQLSYIVNTQHVSKYIEKRRNHESQASISNIQYTSNRHKQEAYSSNEKVLLSSSPDEIIFEFASADYVYPHLHKLEYRLMGFHEDWQELPGNMGTVAYSGLSFGEFDFQVRVVDSKSNASQPVSRYPFTIARPFWFTWPAYGLYVLATVLTVWLIIIAIRRHMAEKSRVLAGIIQQKQSALLESNRSITEMLNKKERIFSNLANEIKTPVMHIINPLAELRKRPLTAEMRSSIDMVYSNAGRLRVLLDQLSAVERLEHISGQSLQRYELANALNYLVETLRPEARKKQLVVSFESQVRGPVLLIQDSLETMLNHLLVNAITYTQPQGHVKIKASHQAGQLIISVKDNGPGMSEAELEFITSRFALGANYNGRDDIGIGLNLANELALANDGWLEIHSQPDMGTEVSVHLPFNPALANDNPESVVEPELVQQVAERAAEYHLNSLPVVLVIERSQAACEYIINLLGTHFNCYSTYSGVQALEIIPVLQPDIILTELNVPDITGIQFTEKLRECEDFADLPVMILTASSDHVSKLESYKASVNDYLIKPVEREELVSRIESNLVYSRLAYQHHKISEVSGEPGYSSPYVKAILPKCNNEKDRKFIIKFLDIIESNYKDERFNRQRAAELMAVSERQLNRTLSKLLPDNFTMFLKKYRLEKSMPMLEQGLQITQIAFEVGFGSGTYYSRCFKQVYGCLPSERETSAIELVD